MKFHFPFTMKAAAEASCAIAAAVLSFQALAAVNPAVQDYARRAAAEGIVMLKNDNDVLPLGKEGPEKVAFFGITQVETFLVGYGSGGDVKPPYRVTLADALAKTDKIVPDQELLDTYKAWAKANPLRAGGWGNWPFYAPEMPLNADQIQAAAKRADTAVLMIGRAAGEDRECRLEPGSYYLTDAEKFLLKEVTGAFKKTVVLLNVGNVIDMAWVKDYKIDSLMYVWQGGMETGNAIVDVLTGKETPSGKLASAIAATYQDYPSSSSFGNREFNNYTEDIYVGYRYFETFAPEKVLYPFGFGLSYTTFDIVDATVKNGDPKKAFATVEVIVKNTGRKYAGREVVQVYCGAPQGKLGKPAKVLVAYAKTNLLKPGETQKFTFTIPTKDCASFDDGGVTGHQAAWVLEPGEYKFYIGNSSRDAKDCGGPKLDSLFVVEQLEPALAIASESVAFDRMKAVEQGGKLVPGTERVPVSKVDLPARVKERLPKAVAETGDKGIKLIDVKQGKNTLDEFVAQLTPTEMETLLRGDGGMGSRLGPAGNASVFGGTLQSVRDKGVPPIPTCDGPSGLRLSANASLLPIGSLLACTWNNDLIEAMYYQVGLEMEMSGVDCILGPGMNIHRNPLCGRNFEYYSEDPLLTGLMAASMTKGVQKAGASTVPKHFALNNQETNRNYNDSRCSERALREIYLRAFEICVKVGKPYNIMGSYNKVNSFWNYYNYDLNTTILRGQWGWTGSLMTDWWAREGASDALHVRNNAWRVRSQMDVLMPGDGPARGKDNSLLESYNQWVAAGRPDGIEAGITLGEMQRSVKNVLNYVMNSRTFRKMHSLPNTYKPGEDWFTIATDAKSDVPTAASASANGGKSGDLFKNAPTEITVNGEKIGFNPAVTAYYLPGVDAATAKIEVTTPAGVEKKVTGDNIVKIATVRTGSGPDAREYTIDFNAVRNGRPTRVIELVPASGSMIDAGANAADLSQGLLTEASQDEGGGQAIINAKVGGVARYAVHTAKDGKYEVSLRVASGQTNTLAQLAIELYVDGQIAATFNANATGGDQKWVSTKSYPVEFKQGFHTLELRWKSDGLNVSRINMRPAK